MQGLPPKVRTELNNAMKVVPEKQKALAEKLAKKAADAKAAQQEAGRTMQQLQKLQAAQHAGMARAHSVGNTIHSSAAAGSAAAAVASPPSKK
jgi:hypothetical protein